MPPFGQDDMFSPSPFGTFDFGQPGLRGYQGINFMPEEEEDNDLQEPDNPFSMAPPVTPSFADLYKEMSRRKQTQAMQKYQNFMQEGVPQPGNVPKLTRLGAVLSGAGAGLTGRNGSQVASEVLERPYRNRLETWNTERQGLKELAGIEEASNRSDLASLKAVADLENDRIREQRLQATANDLIRHRGVLEKNAKEQLEAQNMRIIKSEITGEDLLLDIATGKTKPLGKFSRSAAEKDAVLDRRQDKNINAANTRATLNRNATRANVEFTTNAANERARLAQAGADRRDANNPTRTIEADRAGRRRVEAFIQSHGPEYAPYWKFDSQKQYVDLIPASQAPDWRTDPDGYERYATLYNLLYGDLGTLNPRPGGGSSSNAPPPITRKKPGER